MTVRCINRQFNYTRFQRLKNVLKLNELRSTWPHLPYKWPPHWPPIHETLEPPLTRSFASSGGTTLDPVHWLEVPCMQ